MEISCRRINYFLILLTYFHFRYFFLFLFCFCFCYNDFRVLWQFIITIIHDYQKYY